MRSAERTDGTLRQPVRAHVFQVLKPSLTSFIGRIELLQETVRDFGFTTLVKLLKTTMLDS
jgi:hypothetical protein